MIEVSQTKKQWVIMYEDTIKLHNLEICVAYDMIESRAIW